MSAMIRISPSSPRPELVPESLAPLEERQNLEKQLAAKRARLVSQDSTRDTSGNPMTPPGESYEISEEMALKFNEWLKVQREGEK